MIYYLSEQERLTLMAHSAYIDTVRILFDFYCVGIDRDTHLTPPSPGKKLSFCLSDTVSLCPETMRSFLKTRLGESLNEEELNMALFRVGQEQFLNLRKPVEALSDRWYRLFSGISR